MTPLIANRRSQGHCRKLGEGCPSLGPCICTCDSCKDARHVAMTTALKNGVPLLDVPKKRVMPVQKPGRSIQVVSTPWPLIDFVESRWGKLTWDLAATRSNCKVRFPDGFGRAVNRDARYGPGAKHEDALKMNWGKKRGNMWLNPEFGSIAEWAEKCASTQLRITSKILFLVPASVGSNWWADYVDRKCLVEFLRPRVKFVGHAQGYPKDLALCVYQGLAEHGYECVRWDGKTKVVSS